MNCQGKRFDRKRGNIPCPGDAFSCICKWPGCPKRIGNCEQHGGIDAAKEAMYEHQLHCPFKKGYDYREAEIEAKWGEDE